MATNGNLNFTNVNKVTFEGVGAAPNAVIDTTTGKIGVGVDSPDANLHVVGNCHVSTNMELGGTLVMGTVTVEAQHALSAITATGNTTPHTIEFQNAGTSLVTTGDVVVGGIAQFKNVFFFARATTSPSFDSTNQNTLIDDVQRSNGGLSLSSSGRGVTVASSDAAGVYMVYCQVSIRTESSSERERSQWARLRKNGVWFAQSNIGVDHITGSTYTQHILSCLIDLDAGDEVTHFIDDEGTGIDVYKNATHFYMYRIST